MLQYNRCLICAKTGNYLCKYHEDIYILDTDNNWLRRRKRMQRDVSNRENNRKYHNTETKLHEIIKLLFGKTNVVSGIHPLWAFSSKGVLMEYDMGIIDKHILIEYDGLQHFQFPNYFHKSKCEFLEQKSRDILKTQLAKDNGYKLIRIKYNEEVTYKSIFNKFKQQGVLQCPMIIN